METNKYILINHFLVEMDEEKREIKTKSGIVLPATTDDRPSNYGRVIAAPDVIMVRDYEKEKIGDKYWWQYIEPGDIVFFPLTGLNYVEFADGEPNKKYVLVPVETVQMVYKVAKKEGGADA